MLPEAASSFAPQIDHVFWFIFFLSTFFFFLIVGFMVAFVIRYRNNKEIFPSSQNVWLEVAWTLIPLGLVFVIFGMGWKAFSLQRHIPSNAFELQVTARQWRWEFQTPDGSVSVNNVVIPADTPVRVVVSSKDVIHSFYVPAFRVKMDAVPGRYTYAWFRAKPGTYTLYCAEYCGAAHSLMRATIKVVPPEAYKKLQNTPRAVPATARQDPISWGRELFKAKGCNACHSIDGSPGVGPTLKGIFGHSVQLSDGRTVQVDENYIRRSIVDPASDVVDGYNPVMPPFAGLLSDEEINALIAFIRSLQ